MADTDQDEELTGGVVWWAVDDDDDERFRSLVDRRRTVLPVRNLSAPS